MGVNPRCRQTLPVRWVLQERVKFLPGEEGACLLAHKVLLSFQSITIGYKPTRTLWILKPMNHLGYQAELVFDLHFNTSFV